MKKTDIGQGISLADLLKHLNLPHTGNDSTKIVGLTSFEVPLKNHIAFSTEKRTDKLKRLLTDSPLAALVVHSSITVSELPPSIAYLQVGDPMRAFIELVPLFYQAYPRNGVSPRAAIHASARIGDNVTIGDFVSIGENCVIGDNATIYAHVSIYADVTIGAGTVIHSGAIIRERCEIGAGALIQPNAVIGGDGFGYIPDPQEGIRAVPQIGRVKLGNRVDIGANACVDRGAFSDTVIGQGTKIDNLVQIGHNVRIGAFTIICGGTVVAGSSEIGNQVTLGGNTAIAGHIKISDNVRIAGHSAATHSIKEKGDYGGFPAVPVSMWRRQVASLRRLPELFGRRKKSSLQSDEESEE